VTARTVCVESANLRAIATVNGRVRVPVLLFALNAPDMALATDSLNPTSSKERVQFLAMALAAHPELDMTGEVAPLLERLAAEVAAASVTATRDVADGEPFPTVDPWPEPVSGDVLLNAIVVILRRYIGMPSAATHAAALWVVHTWAFEVADFTPYLLVTSPVRSCGKSTLLDVLETIASRPRRSDGMSAAALYRVIDKWLPSVLLDEIDTRLRGDGGEALRGVLNSGFHRAGRVTLCVGDDHEARDFRTFAPKVLCGIGRVWDTVESRSIPIRLARATPAELRRLRKVIGATIRDETASTRAKCARWAADHRSALEARPLPPVPAELSARQADIWRPLFAIADVVGGRWRARARAAALALHGGGEDENDHALLLLEDVRGLFQQGADKLRSAAIVAALVVREDRPWPEMPSGRALTTRGLAKLLGQFGVRPVPVRDAEGVGRGYKLEHLVPMFGRYLPVPESEWTAPIPRLSATSDTNGASPYQTGCSGLSSGRRNGDATAAATRLTEENPARVADVADTTGAGAGLHCLDDYERDERAGMADG
jgi:hypothetical protein